MKHFIGLLLVVAYVAVIPAYAHHSFARFYFENETFTVTGEIVEFEYRSPHAWVYVMATDERGEMQRFAAEWSNPSRLGRSKILKDTLKPGDRVIVTGSPARTQGDHKLHLKGILRPADGWKWGSVQVPR